MQGVGTKVGNLGCHLSGLRLSPYMAGGTHPTTFVLVLLFQIWGVAYVSFQDRERGRIISRRNIYLNRKMTRL